MSDMAEQSQASQRNNEDPFEAREAVNGKRLSLSNPSSTTLQQLPEIVQPSSYVSNPAKGNDMRKQRDRSTLRLQGELGQDLSEPHVLARPNAAYSELPLRAAPAGPREVHSIHRTPHGRFSSGGAVQKLPFSTSVRDLRPRRRLVDRTRRITAPSKAAQVNATLTIPPSKTLLPDRSVTTKLPSPPWRLWTDPTRTVCRQPPLWTTNGRILSSDTDIRFGNVISPCCMIGLPFAASGMIEVAQRYPEEETCEEGLSEESARERLP